MCFGGVETAIHIEVDESVLIVVDRYFVMNTLVTLRLNR